MKTSHHIVTRYQTTQFMSLEQLTNSKIQMKTTIYIYKKNSLKKTTLFQIVLEIGHTYLFLNCCDVIKLL